MNINDSLYQAVHAYPGGVEALAVRMGISATSLWHKASPTYPGAHLSPDQVAQVIEFCGTGPLHAYAARARHVAHPLPDGDMEGAIEELAEAMREASELFVQSASALGDRKVDAGEISEVRRHALGTFKAVAQLLSRMESIYTLGQVPPTERAAAAAAQRRT